MTLCRSQPKLFKTEERLSFPVKPLPAVSPPPGPAIYPWSMAITHRAFIEHCSPHILLRALAVDSFSSMNFICTPRRARKSVSPMRSPAATLNTFAMHWDYHFFLSIETRSCNLGTFSSAHVHRSLPLKPPRSPRVFLDETGTYSLGETSVCTIRCACKWIRVEVRNLKYTILAAARRDSRCSPGDEARAISGWILSETIF